MERINEIKKQRYILNALLKEILREENWQEDRRLIEDAIKENEEFIALLDF